MPFIFNRDISVVRDINVVYVPASARYRFTMSHKVAALRNVLTFDGRVTKRRMWSECMLSFTTDSSMPPFVMGYSLCCNWTTMVVRINVNKGVITCVWNIPEENALDFLPCRYLFGYGNQKFPIRIYLNQSYEMLFQGCNMTWETYRTLMYTWNAWDNGVR